MCFPFIFHYFHETQKRFSAKNLVQKYFVNFDQKVFSTKIRVGLIIIYISITNLKKDGD